MKLLDGRVALISGVGDGLGADTARLFVEHGAAVVVSARKPDFVNALAEEISKTGGKILPVTADITSVDDCKRTVQSAIEAFGKLDALVNVAFHTSFFDWAPLEKQPEDISTWRRDFDVNLFGTMQMCRAALPHMIARKSGRIIVVNSMNAKILVPGGTSYAASKAALEVATQTLALEVAHYGIRVNSICPGWMWGTSVQQALDGLAQQNGTSLDAERAKVEAQIPLGYIPHTREFAGTILFLASDLALPVTGEMIHVNGGQYLG